MSDHRTTETSDRSPLLTARSDGARFDTLATHTHNDLRKIADSLPSSVWVIATIELCERFAFFGIIGPMQNYIQNTRHDPLHPGGIGTLSIVFCQ